MTVDELIKLTDALSAQDDVGWVRIVDPIDNTTYDVYETRLVLTMRGGVSTTEVHFVINRDDQPEREEP